MVFDEASLDDTLVAEALKANPLDASYHGVSNNAKGKQKKGAMAKNKPDEKKKKIQDEAHHLKNNDVSCAFNVHVVCGTALAC
eukprot:13832762-Alexandrium_andersonii.AAC.1